SSTASTPHSKPPEHAIAVGFAGAKVCHRYRVVVQVKKRCNETEDVITKDMCITPNDWTLLQKFEGQ
ncbi:MAG: hypothetical protein KDA52_24990, partial [Planctomycetaceae bacterium]|nr:hypothetical protein [Planctomycetaceae bacterium]